jgi:hypothetical protein
LYYGHSTGPWFVVLIPFAIFLVLRLMASSGRQRSQGRPPPQGSFFTGPPTGPPGSTPRTAQPRTDAPTTEGAVGTAAGWFTDPFVRHEQRYWSGTEWTDHVQDAGVPSTDPPPAPRPDAGPVGDTGTDPAES